ncbi:MAG: PEP-CTERM sorting domain-containing protein, partial [Planctomycetota bacterium]
VAVTSVASASIVSIQPIPEGEPGSASNPLMPSDEIVVLLYTDTALYQVSAVLTIDSGSATIVAAMGPVEAPSYGWEPGWNTLLPIGVPGPVVEISGAHFLEANPGPVIGYWLVRCDDYGPVVASLSAGASYGNNRDIYGQEPDFVGTITIYQVPEPLTVGLLGLGGLLLLRRRK